MYLKSGKNIKLSPGGFGFIAHAAGADFYFLAAYFLGLQVYVFFG